MQLKDPRLDLNKSCIVHKFNCFCERSYIRQTSRHFKTRIKEHLPAYVFKFIEEKPEIKTTTTTKNAAKRFSIAEHLINSNDCGRKYKISRFEIINHCNSVFDLVKLEAISIFLNKPKLCKQEELDYKGSLFT